MNLSDHVESNAPKYITENISDFFEQWLLELRVLHYEITMSLRDLKAGDVASVWVERPTWLTQDVVGRLKTFHRKYNATLAFAKHVDSDGVSDEDLNNALIDFYEQEAERLDELIGRLEVIREPLNEALTAAKVPMGVTKSGEVFGPVKHCKLRE